MKNKFEKYKVERNVPMPVKGCLMDNLTTVIKSMNIGDSLVVDKRSRTRVYAVAHYHGFRVAIRTEGDHLRAWRIE